MNSNVKNFLFLLVAVIVGWFAIKWVLALALGIILNVLVPVAIVGGIIYVAYLAFGRKALGGGRRYLP